jgi:hypothetical protein
MLVRMLSQLSDHVNRFSIINAVLVSKQALAVLEIKTEALENGLVQARSEVSRGSMYFVAHCMFLFCLPALSTFFSTSACTCTLSLVCTLCKQFPLPTAHTYNSVYVAV